MSQSLCLVPKRRKKKNRKMKGDWGHPFKSSVSLLSQTARGLQQYGVECKSCQPLCLNLCDQKQQSVIRIQILTFGKQGSCCPAISHKLGASCSYSSCTAYHMAEGGRLDAATQLRAELDKKLTVASLPNLPLEVTSFQQTLEF